MLLKLFSTALCKITGLSCSPIRMPFWLILERTQDWTRSYHSVNNWSLFPKVLAVFVLNCVNVKEYCSVQVPTWSKNIGSVGLFRSFTHFLPMSWNFLVCWILDKDNFFLDMFQLKVLRNFCCFPIGCFALTNHKLILKTWVLCFGYGLSVSLKDSCVGSLVFSVVMLRGRGTYKRWGLAGGL